METKERTRYGVSKGEQNSKQEDISQNEDCNECGGQLKEDESGETVCKECGLVHNDVVIDHGPEWRSFEGDNDKKSRVGMPTTNLMHDKGLSTKIGWSQSDQNGNQLTSNKKRQLSRLRKWNKRNAKSSKQRGLKHALSEIQRMGSALGTSKSVMETASMIFRQAHEREMVQGRSIETMAAASLYAAARQCGSPRSLDEIYPVTRVNTNYDKEQKQKEINSAARYIIKELNLKLGPPKPEKFINRFVNDLPINSEDRKNAVKKTAREMIQISKEVNNHSGKSPTSIAGGAIYAACLIQDERITQKTISEVADITSVTIRNRYNEILNAYEEEKEV